MRKYIVGVLLLALVVGGSAAWGNCKRPVPPSGVLDPLPAPPPLIVTTGESGYVEPDPESYQGEFPLPPGIESLTEWVAYAKSLGNTDPCLECAWPGSGGQGQAQGGAMAQVEAPPPPPKIELGPYGPVFNLNDDENVYFNNEAQAYQMVSNDCIAQLAAGSSIEVGTAACPVIAEVSYEEAAAQTAAAAGEEQQ
jgi:hypothetical protein